MRLRWRRGMRRWLLVLVLCLLVMLRWWRVMVRCLPRRVLRALPKVWLRMPRRRRMLLGVRRRRRTLLTLALRPLGCLLAMLR